jgi:acid-sensing ion channel 2/acid-sensing ion channel 1
MEKGVHIFINNKTIGINAFDGYDVPVGQNLNIALRKTFIKKLEYPYSDCIETGIKSSYFDRIKRANRYYRQKDCFELLCFPEYLHSKCGCYDPRASDYYPNNLCSTVEEFSCMFYMYLNFYMTDFQANCNCPLECSSVKYELITSSSTYPSENYAKLLLNNSRVTDKFKESVDFDLLKKSILSLNIYFDDLQYTEMNQIKKIELVDLVSGIGVSIII